MQTTSNVWQSLWQSGSARLEARATIGGTVYDGISAPVLSRATMGSGLGAGNAVSASCAFSLRSASDSIPKAAAVAVEMRLTDGTTNSEWLPAGTFYISRRACDPVTGRLSLECYDALLKANAVWTPSAGDWPRSMAAVAAELAALLGVQQDGRNVIHTGNDYQISQPGAGATVRDVLSQIGAAHGGNWIITPANRLRLVPVVYDGDAVTVAGVLGRMDAGAAGTISGIRCVVDGQAFLTGDETGAVLSLTGAIAAWGPLLEDDVIGERWQPFQLSGAVYDPAAELGDIITAGANGEASGPLCRETVTLGALPRGDIAAPGTEEAADEYPYIGQAAKTLAVAKAYADDVSAAAADALDSALTQLEIFNRLTGNGAAQGLFLVNGQLYVNASYISAGYLSDANNRNHWDLVNGEFVTTRGKIGSWTLSNGALTKTGGDYMYSYDISIDPNNVKYKLKNNPNDWTEQCMLTHEGLSFGYKEGSLQYCNSKMFFGGEYGASNEPVSYVGLRADGPVASGEDRGFMLYSGNSSSPGLNVYAEMYVDRDVTLHVPLPVASGGTGANTAAAARANLGALGASDVVNNLTSQETQKPLSAAQGKVLNDKLKDRAALYTGAAVPDNSTSYSLSEPYTRFEYILINARTNVDYQTMLVKTDDITSSSNYMFSAFQNNQTGLTTAFSYMAACVVTFTDTMHFKVNGSWTNANWILKPVNIWGINRK